MDISAWQLFCRATGWPNVQPDDNRVYVQDGVNKVEPILERNPQVICCQCATPKMCGRRHGRRTLPQYCHHGPAEGFRCELTIKRRKGHGNSVGQLFNNTSISNIIILQF